MTTNEQVNGTGLGDGSGGNIGAIDIFTEELGVPTSAWAAGQDSGEVSRGEPPFRRAIAA